MPRAAQARVIRAPGLGAAGKRRGAGPGFLGAAAPGREVGEVRVQAVAWQ